MLISCTRGGGAARRQCEPRFSHQRRFRQPLPGELIARPTPPLAVLPGAQPPEDPRAVQRRQRHLLLPHHLRRTGEEVKAWLPSGPGKRVGCRELNTLGGGMIFLQDDDSWFYLDSSSTPPSRHRRPSSESCKPR